jgi:hypothetical protein
MVNFENQTDDIESFSSWTQAPTSIKMVESGHEKQGPFTDILLQQPVGKSQQNDPTALTAFLRKAGNLILEMLAEDAYAAKTRSVRQRIPAEEPLLIGQESFGKHLVFEKCEIENVSVSDTSSPFFLLCHSVYPKSGGQQKDRLRGFVSGWNSLSISDPDFVLATYDVPSRAVALLADGEAVVAGHRDGSLACWDRRDVCVPYNSLASGLEEAEDLENGAGLQIRLPCFHSCASKDDNHNRTIVDLVTYPLQETHKSKSWSFSTVFASFVVVVFLLFFLFFEGLGNTACASLDESGVILTWHVIARSADEAWKEVDIAGATPGGRILLVRIRRLTTWAAAIFPHLTASKIVIDPADGMVFFVNCSDGRIRSVHRDGAVLQPNVYGTNHSSGTTTGTSGF